MKRIFTVMLLCMASLAEAQIQRSDVLLMELSAWRARAGFHQLSLNGNAAEDIQALEKILSEGATYAERIRANADSETLPIVGELVSRWQELSVRALDNPLATLGYADFNAFSELNTLVVDISNQCQKLADGAAPGPQDGLVSMGVNLQRLASEYLALTAFPSAGINTGTSEESMNFAEEAMKFEQSLEAQEARYKDDQQIQRVLAQTRTRWSFIRNAVPERDNPDSAKVPLLFHRYSNQIANDLTGLAN
ncbi:MAG: hypothetical protein V2I38_10815 [Alcanivoracaceae bacterium]|jgi:hypothetical protein|nr:hypothetical protein [Alcanivoracaceae bacterium]